MSRDRNPQPEWIPDADVLVNATGELVLKFALPDLKKEDLEITIDGQRVTLTGYRPNPDADAAQYLVRELHYGRFESVLDVPEEFDLMRARAAYQNGMLRIVAPRRTFTS